VSEGVTLCEGVRLRDCVCDGDELPLGDCELVWLCVGDEVIDWLWLCVGDAVIDWL
jgi:hypothetical protein